VTLTTQSHLVPRSRMIRSYISSRPWRLHGVPGEVASVSRPFIQFSFLSLCVQLFLVSSRFCLCAKNVLIFED
jgi:hypothetical protein